MQMSEILDSDAIIAEIKAKDKKFVLEELADFLYQKKLVSNKEEVFRVLSEREKLGSTGIGENVAIPHAKMKGLDKIVAAFGISKKGIDFDSLDRKPVNFVFVLLTPEKATGNHLKALVRISRLLKNPEFRSTILKAPDKISIYKIILKEDSKLE